METVYLRAGDRTAVAEAAGWLRRGYPVVFPTDTVYGVGVTPFDGAAIERLYAAKARPSDKGIPVLLADAADVERVATGIPPAAAELMARFWPGPLTVIVPRRPELPAALSPNDAVAVRVPDHAVARALIRAAGGAVAASSANVSGEAAALSGMAALAALRGVVAAVLDDGPSPGGQPSTIVDCTGARPAIVRAGPLSAADLGL
ncbi:L-threonylcarbamoyladenylate synthase [Promineifilum sp.]|uniref:L-threonylcarbamoyladenylate synthase n=1 Tax=Promineifilum sp. TaxID=2664178 RepID=UPI0035AF7F15